MENPAPTQPTPQPDSDPIRAVDFENFTYHWYPQWDEIPPRRSEFTLRHGEVEVDNYPLRNEPRGFIFLGVWYGDLTEDRKEEAVVTLKIRSGGTSKPHAILVYAMRKGSPELLWVHETGDRGIDGLRSVFIENRHLVIDQYNQDERYSTRGAETYTRTTYEWRGKKFQAVKAEKLLNDLEDREARVLLNLGPPSP